MDDPFLKTLASARPVPGGGSAAAHGALVGLTLLEKIVRVEFHRHIKDTAERGKWEKLYQDVRALTDALRRLREEDGQAYMELAEQRNARGNDESEKYCEAVMRAIDCPSGIMTAAAESAELIRRTAEHCKRHLLCDLLVVCELVEAGFHGAHHIARANLPLLGNGDVGADRATSLESAHDQGLASLRDAKEKIIAAIKR